MSDGKKMPLVLIKKDVKINQPVYNVILVDKILP
uniref:Uncharacterized protein n=1 Tax=Lepeophtheirus salmonis TaxID=72036 RepID=A0A0K2UQ15_LEPSM